MLAPYCEVEASEPIVQELGIRALDLWRAIYPDRTYDIWASISRDAGKTFSEALRISHGKSPATEYYRNGRNFGDDIQDLSMDKENMPLVWGDYRAGFLGVWYGRVALSSFKMP